MPHRIPIMTNTLTTILEGTILATLVAWQSMLALISDKDWDRLLGENGFKVALLPGLVVVWGTSERRLANERRDKAVHHRELVDALAAKERKEDENTERLAAINIEQIKAQGLVINEIKDLRREFRDLATELKTKS